MKRNGRDFLEGVRSLDEGAKQRLLIVSSVAVMVIVVAIWIFYFNNIIMAPTGDSGVATSTSPAAASPSPSGPGFWHTVENDLSGLANIFTGGHQYIQPSH